MMDVFIYLCFNIFAPVNNNIYRSMKTIRVVVMMMAISLIPASMVAQKCKFDIEAKDKFTGELVRSSKFKAGGAFYSWWLQLQEKGGKYYMTYQIAVNGKVDEPIRKGSKILMKLEDNTIVELEIDQDYNPQQNVENVNTASPFISSTWLPKG